jgi:hypothetical protein
MSTSGGSVGNFARFIKKMKTAGMKRRMAESGQMR